MKPEKPSYVFKEGKNVGIFYTPDNNYKPSKLRKIINWFLRKPNPTVLNFSDSKDNKE